MRGTRDGIWACSYCCTVDKIDIPLRIAGAVDHYLLHPTEPAILRCPTPQLAYDAAV